jgi:tellurium resistance protein TerD
MSNNDDDDFFKEEPAPMAQTGAAVRIKPGQEINLISMIPTLREIEVGVGWDLKRFEGDPIDVDVSIFLLDKNDKTKEDEDFIFYNNSSARDGAVRHMGDSRTGAGDGDDEKISIDLMALPFDIVKIAFFLSVYDLNTTINNNFTMVKNVYFRILNAQNQIEMFRFELDQDLGDTAGIYIGYLDRVGNDWVYKAIGEPVQGGLSKIATDYGIIVAENIRA